jgi:oligopeptide/dipeptide ABC transporter ATP-binding protein
LDNLVQSNVLQLFRRIAAERNVAVLFITHSLAAAWDVCDRVTVMHRGRVVEAGTRDAVFHSPRHPYSREIMRSARKVAHESWASDVDAELSGTACAFCKRCPRSSKRCEQVRPSLENFNGHAVACHHPILTEGAVSLTNT